MEKIKKMNVMFQELFKVRSWFYFFPFALIGFIFALCFYLVSPFYMLFDLFKRETYALLHTDNNSKGSQIVRDLIGFSLAFFVGFVSVCFLFCLAIFYFLTVISFYVSSVGEFKINPFAFHETEQSL